MTFQRKPVQQRFEALEKPLPISFAPEQVLPGIALVHYVIGGAWVFYPSEKIPQIWESLSFTPQNEGGRKILLIWVPAYCLYGV